MQSSPRWRVDRARRGRRERSARTIASPCSFRVIVSSRQAASAGMARSVSSTNGACWHSSMSLSEDGRGQVFLHLDLAESAVARRAFSLLREVGLESEIRTYRQRSFAQPTRYQLHVEGGAEALRVLHDAGVLDVRHAPLERPPRRVVRRACCRRAYLRGALLGGGSLSGPRAPHLEVRATGVGGAQFLSNIGDRDHLRLSVLDRGRHAVAYAKGADAIADVLAAAGASNAVLALEERAVLGATKARANRDRKSVV